MSSRLGLLGTVKCKIAAGASLSRMCIGIWSDPALSGCPAICTKSQAAAAAEEEEEELRCAVLMASFPFEPKLAKPSTMALWNADIFHRAWRQRRSLDDDQVQGDIIMRWARVLAEEGVPDLLCFNASALEAMPWQRIREIALDDPMIWERRTESARAKLVCAVSVIGTAQAIHDAHAGEAQDQGGTDAGVARRRQIPDGSALPAQIAAALSIRGVSSVDDKT